ncbi:MAG: serine/threonine protein kinase, partial [Planctomycetes bacterium]|nr:serine/threonine protein kinase [Planctomycetota bacterium]
MAAGDQRDSTRGHDVARKTATGRSAAEEETVPPAKRVRSEPAPDVAARSLDLPSKLGRYEVKKCLGRGAMGAVFLAHDTELDRKVALKVPLGDTSEGSEWLERFRREARAAGALRHANICPIFDVAEIDGFHLIAMAFVEGSPLSEVIASGKQIPIRKAVQVVRKIASALADAHEQKIIHRDLKPANIMIDGKGEPIVMDFGLARQVTVAGDEQLTREGDVAGSPAYMSPEQFDGRPEAIGPASDIYSLGVILFELLTGEIPFRGSMMEIMAQILKKPVPAPSTLREDVDESLDQICRKMTARKEANRFGSMKSVVKGPDRIPESGHRIAFCFRLGRGVDGRGPRPDQPGLPQSQPACGRVQIRSRHRSSVRTSREAEDVTCPRPAARRDGPEKAVRRIARRSRKRPGLVRASGAAVSQSTAADAAPTESPSSSRDLCAGQWSQKQTAAPSSTFLAEGPVLPDRRENGASDRAGRHLPRHRRRRDGRPVERVTLRADRRRTRP